ncbi:MAG: hypothetical protein MMC23_009461 [Stictis urceolatum]|nr:hypothetical protein [Stictis urceolata]
MAITRKPFPQKGASNQPGEGSLPYPVTPVSPKQDFENFRADHENANHRVNIPHRHEPVPASQSNTSIPSVSELSEGWVDGDIRSNEDHTQSQISVVSAGTSNNQPLPSALKVGMPGLTPKSSSESQREARATSLRPATEVPASLRVSSLQGGRSTNPFHRTHSSERQTPSSPVSDHLQNSSDIWQEMLSNPTPPSAASPGPSTDSQSTATPLAEFNNLSMEDRAKQSGFLETVTAKGVGMAQGTDQNPFADDYRQEIEASPWASKNSAGNADTDPFGELSAFDEVSNHRSQSEEEAPKFSVISDDGTTNFRPETSVPPPYHPPPRVVKEQQNTQEPEDPLQVQIPSCQTNVRSEAETPNTRVQRQRSETYQIKHIRWLDSTPTETRTTPIMIQNANGPCPLLALVNALTLSTPVHLATPLVETLRVRENVTLGLLLDAVFDELMSGRRGNTAQQLPDVGELYTFLINLHTGLNVNPRFTPVSTQSANLIEGFESPALMSYESRRAGAFEETKEMKLYATFSVPLIHGWLPPRTHPAFSALQRSATTYEDAQNLLFLEEELEDKLQRTGLSSEEQQLLEDIASVKYFLSSSATQLTGYGLDTITDTLYPGSIAILFRNDHFSTLYKHPRTGQILTLVTDAGYEGHAEVVWESLVDVSGEGSEFFSGDFRPVGNHSTSSQPSSFSQSDTGGWTTVPARSSRTRSSISTTTQQPSQAFQPPASPEYTLPSPHNTEQEDADLALAMQLQEEEEENNRREAEARRREEEESASQAYLSQTDTQTQAQIRGGGASPGGARGSSRHTSQQPNTGRRVSNTNVITANSNIDRGERPLPMPPRPGGNNPRDPEAGEDAPPPSYEQASKSKPYHGPTGAGQGVAGQGPGRQSYTGTGVSGGSVPEREGTGQTAYGAHRASIGSRGGGGGPSVHRRTSGIVGGLDEGLMAGVARRRSGPAGQVGARQGPTGIADGGRRERDCCVM